MAGSSKTDFKGVLLSTYHPKSGDITRKWYVIDATDVVLGRLASQVTDLLRGKGNIPFKSKTISRLMCRDIVF